MADDDETKGLPRGPEYMKQWSDEIAAKLNEHEALLQAIKAMTVSPQSAGMFMFAEANAVLVLNTVECPDA